LASYDRQKWRSNRIVENSVIKVEAKNGSSKKEVENEIAKKRVQKSLSKLQAHLISLSASVP
jgi:hypothetical protein